MDQDGENIVFRAGIDLGSTTIKFILTDSPPNIVFSEYQRHNTEINTCLENILKKIYGQYGDISLSPVITGSVGMGFAEKLDIPFIQEVIAAGEAVTTFYPETSMMIDIGGEDSKMIFFNKNSFPDIRMNGNCAGGTGAFIDQMAALMNISVKELDDLATNHNNIYPVSSRCGVFCKTDIQNLLSKNIPKQDIAASIFHAVALQTATTLLRGSEVKKKIIFSGGPLFFYKSLQQSLLQILKISEDDIINTKYPLHISALGTAIAQTGNKSPVRISQFIDLINKSIPVKIPAGGLKPLFSDNHHFKKWEENKYSQRINRISIRELDNKDSFLGVDSGSTTSKLVLTNNKGEIAFKWYGNNQGDPLGTVKKALLQLRSLLDKKNINTIIRCSVVTGYGEDLIRTAFGLNEGIVETVAHYKAAARFDKDVSFILDMGGQDMKAVFVKDGRIDNVEINEACSSGCGSFIETFASSLGIGVEEFAKKACIADDPCQLGSRCTVFMNSRLKQSLRENAGIENISAGLAYSVIKNCFNKVLKIRDTSILGNNIIVTGGTFRNPAILRALELFLNKEVIRPDICEIMGAYGCALAAIEKWQINNQDISTFKGFEFAETIDNHTKSNITCKGCNNKCLVTKYDFASGKTFFSGNRCDNIFSNYDKNISTGTNIFKIKEDLLFNNNVTDPAKPLLTIGIPRVLNMFENYPFWSALFGELNIKVVLSDLSSTKHISSGASTLLSDNICFPAKLVHGHIIDLIEKKVDRIFFPMVRYEEEEFPGALNTFNCPVVTGYPDVIRSAMDPEKYGVKYDIPTMVFNNKKLLEKACFKYLRQFNIRHKDFSVAFKKAMKQMADYRHSVRKAGNDILLKAKHENRQVILLACRPYHLDPAINHRIPEMISNMGIDVISEDGIPADMYNSMPDVAVLSQWQYSNRLYQAAKWAGKEKNIHFIHLNSFGCGPDTVVVDEVKSIMDQYGKSSTVIRIDEINSAGSIRLRLRSLVESLKMIKHKIHNTEVKQRKTTPPYIKSDKEKLILIPNISDYYSLFSESILYQKGYKVEMLPQADRESIETGLKYVNNDICFPAVILIGDIIKALQSGRYDLNKTVVALSETGGQCRASNYVPLLKKAMINAGFDTIPVLAVSTNPSTMNYQPGFKTSFLKMFMLSMNSLIYTDALMKMYNTFVLKEKNKGEAKQIFDRYISMAFSSRNEYYIRKSLSMLRNAVHDFNLIELKNENITHQKAGIVGEIFMKYNPCGNNHIREWLNKKGIEVVTSPLNTFFLESFTDIRFNHNNNIEKSNRFILNIYKLIEERVNNYIFKANKVLENLRFETIQIPTIEELSRKAEKAGSLIHQYGEGWMLPGEVVMMYEEGVSNILSIQPFGCIANHVVARGLSKRIKDLYPEINLLLLDMDADTSEVNNHNRLEFFVRNAKHNCKNSCLKKINSKH